MCLTYTFYTYTYVYTHTHTLVCGAALLTQVVVGLASAARALTEPNEWLRRLMFVPPQSLVDLMQMVDGVSDKLEEMGKLAAKATGEAIAEARTAHAAAVASGEEPPALV